MDEATIDCSWCNRDAVLEFRHDRLDDAAEWRRMATYRACFMHSDKIVIPVAYLSETDRVVVQRCG